MHTSAVLLLLSAALVSAGRPKAWLVEVDCADKDDMKDKARQMEAFLHPDQFDANAQAMTQAASEMIEKATAIRPIDDLCITTITCTDTEVNNIKARFDFVKTVLADDVITADVTTYSCGDTQATAQSGWHLRRTTATGSAIPNTFRYDATWGAGVDAYVVDSGVDCDHEEFQAYSGKCAQGHTVFGTDISDGSGHGTHVAGILGGQYSGIAQAANIVAVKVLDASGRGSYGGVIEGISWAWEKAHNESENGRKSVINISIGGGIYSLLDLAVAKAVNNGTTVVVSAGNSGTDACQQSPAKSPEVITVGSITYNSSSAIKSDFSNYGTCVDIFAPGSAVNSSTSKTSVALATDNNYRQLSGTSMSSPLVAGMAAMFLSQESGTPTPAEVRAWLLGNALQDIIALDTTENSPNVLAHIPCTAAMPTIPADFSAFEENCYESYITDVHGGPGQLDYPEGSGNYEIYHTGCFRITCHGQIDLTWDAMNFNVENTYDFLFVDGVSHTGTTAPGRGVYQDSVVLRLVSDSYVGTSGFIVDYTCTPNATPFPPTPAPFPPTPAPLAVDTEFNALLALKERLYDSVAGGIMSGWTGTDYCSWSGISCGGGIVVVIQLNGETTRLNLVPDLSVFTHLFRLHLKGTNVQGFDGLPTSLQQLEITDTQINGPFPVETLACPNLMTLTARNAGITGPMPVFQQSLYHIDISQNAMTGAFTTLPSGVKNFIARYNQFTGNLPPSSSAIRIIVNNNLLTGPLIAYPALLVGYFHWNQMVGGYTPSDMPLCTHLDLSNNKFDGVMPNLAGTAMKLFKAYRNEFTGPFHLAHTGQTPLLQYIVNNNKMTGPEPSAAEGAAVASYIKTFHNHWGMLSLVSCLLFYFS